MSDSSSPGQPTLHPALARLDFWLDESVWQERDPVLIIERLIALLTEWGIPLLRVNIALATLHPEIVGTAHIWDRKTGTVLHMTGDRETAMAPGIYERTPFHLAIEHGITGIRRRLDRPDCPDDFDVLAELRAEGATDYVVIATGSFDDGGSIGTWSTDRPGGFTTPELVAISEHTRLLGHVLASISARRTARNLVDTYVGRRAGERILAGDIVRGRGTDLDAAIRLSDIRDFTGLSQRLLANDLLALLNAHFDTLIKPVQDRGGEVLKLMGDAILAVFPADGAGGAEAACAAALDAAYAARKVTGENTALRYAVALHFGTVSFGNVGASNRLGFTVIGPAVNLVSRLNGLAKHLERDIVMSAEFADHVPCTAEPLGEHELRGLTGRHVAFAPAGATS